MQLATRAARPHATGHPFQLDSAATADVYLIVLRLQEVHLLARVNILQRRLQLDDLLLQPVPRLAQLHDLRCLRAHNLLLGREQPHMVLPLTRSCHQRPLQLLGALLL